VVVHPRSTLSLRRYVAPPQNVEVENGYDFLYHLVEFGVAMTSH